MDAEDLVQDAWVRWEAAPGREVRPPRPCDAATIGKEVGIAY